jgi:O-antigen/teichoic acid export membrane protein
MSNVKKIIKNTGIVFFGNNAFKILSMILVFMIARSLGEIEYGKFSFVLSFTGLFFILMDLGTRILIVREIAENKSKAPKIVSNAIILKVIVSFGVYLIIIASAFFLKYDLNLIYGIALAALGIVFDSLSTTIESIFQAYENLAIPSLLKVIRVVVRFLITLPLLFLSKSFFLVLIAFVFVQFLNFVVSLIFCYRSSVKPVFDFDFKFMIGLVKRSFPFLLSGIFVTVYFRIDITLMSKLAPEMLAGVYSNVSRDAVIGWYSAAYNILDGLISLPIAVSTAILPVAIIYFTQSKEKLLQLYKLSLKYLIYLAIPMAVGVTMLSDKIVVLIYRSNYLNASLALQILVWTMIPLSINYVLGVMMTAIHQEKASVYVLFGNCILNILLNLILIPRWSLYGAAVATVVSEIFYFAGYYYIISKNFEKVNIFAMMIKPAISGTIMGISLYYLSAFNLFVLILLGVLIYFCVMLLLKAFDKREILMIKDSLKAKN